MKKEIKRKFLVHELPSLKNIELLRYERYILNSTNGKVTRVQKVNDVYFYEEKNDLSILERSGVKRELTKEEFESLEINSKNKAIIRDRYNVAPNISIQIYHGDFEGLIRAEVDFRTQKEAQTFKPSDWMGKEITSLPIARDATLLELSQKEFEDCLQS